MGLVKQPHGGAIYHASKGEVKNPHGRPRKIVNKLKIAGYKLDQINDAIQKIVAMHGDELNSLINNEDATTLELTIASALQKSIEKGDLTNIETLLNRVYGKPNISVEIKEPPRTHTLIDESKTPVEAARIYKSMVSN